MKSSVLYQQLDTDFIKSTFHDEWARYMPELSYLLSDNFKERSMGVMCDFADEIRAVYTAVFPSDKVMRKLFEGGVTDSLLFLHHASNWDIRRPKPLYPMDAETLEKCRERRISLYVLHVPLDDFGEYGTSRTLADELKIMIEKPFALYGGALCGVIGKTACTSVQELSDRFSKAVGHPTKLYPYGDEKIRGGRIAIAAGGGNNRDVFKEMQENQVDVLLTGVSLINDKTAELHRLEKENRVNVLGGTHYSTEKFACCKMVRYFEKLGLTAQFVVDTPMYEDM